MRTSMGGGGGGGGGAEKKKKVILLTGLKRGNNNIIARMSIIKKAKEEGKQRVAVEATKRSMHQKKGAREATRASGKGGEPLKEGNRGRPESEP